MGAPLFYLIAGEPSGDVLGARLMAALRERTGGEVGFAGIGGEAMRDEGLSSLFPQSELAVMGLAEVVPRIPAILRRLDETIADIEARHPVAIVTIDSWGFTGRVAKRLTARGSTVPRFHYVAPMVWAWKEKRARELAGRVDLLLCLLPNEPPYFERVGLKALHVGHPVIESPSGDGAAFRARHGLTDDAPLLCLLPGSRHSETSRLLPVFARTAAALAASHPGLRVVMPTVETVAGEVERAVATWTMPVLVVKGAAERADAFAASRAALAASGTVALELALAGLPMVIVYKASPLTALIARRLLKVRYASLPNLLVDDEIIPEFLQEECRPERLIPVMERLLDDEGTRATQRRATGLALERLGMGGARPSFRAAEAILNDLENRAGAIRETFGSRPLVMAGLDPAIHGDPRVAPGDDEKDK